VLITDAYRNMNAQMHKDKSAYGTSGHRWGAEVAILAQSHRTRSILDYGSGKGTLNKCLKGLEVTNYDPAIEGIDGLPSPHDIVVSTDVMEHIEPELLDPVLNHIHSLTGKIAFLVICTRAAKKVLPDKRNAHLIIENKAWWENRLDKYFQTITWIPEDGLLAVYALPKRTKKC